MFCEKYYKKLLSYAKKDQIWADPNCPYRRSLCCLGHTPIKSIMDSMANPCFSGMYNLLSQNNEPLQCIGVTTF